MTSDVLTVDGRSVRVRVEGDPAHPPVVLVHGIGRSLEDWDELSPLLATDYRVIRLDTPGFGYSDPMPGPISHQALGHGIASALEAIGETRPVHAIGNSLGGSTVMEFAAAYPDRVRSMTLLNSAGFGATVTPLLRALAIPGIGWLGTRRTTRASARLLENAIYADRSFVTNTRIERAVRIGNRPGNGDFMHRMARHLSTPWGVRPGWRSRLLRAVAEVNRPILIVWGDQDKVVPPDHLRNAQAAFPAARTHMFVGVGHMPQIEVPDRCARLIRDFLATA